MAKVRIAEAAQRDLRDIRIYSKAAFGPTVTTAYMAGLRRVFGLLRERPLAGSAEADLGDAARSFSYRSHCIYYDVFDDEVLIVRILHVRRDATAVFLRGVND